VKRKGSILEEKSRAAGSMGIQLWRRMGERTKGAVLGESFWGRKSIPSVVQSGGQETDANRRSHVGEGRKQIGGDSGGFRGGGKKPTLWRRLRQHSVIWKGYDREKKGIKSGGYARKRYPKVSKGNTGDGNHTVASKEQKEYSNLSR